MPHRPAKIISFLLCFLLIFEQSLPAGRQVASAQVAGQLDISSHILNLRNSLIQDKFRPLHLRYLSYDNVNNNFRLLLDKGDWLKGALPKEQDLEGATKTLLNYFFIGITLPNDSFWVNLRPDSPDNIIDSALAMTDVGKILLEADLQLKKDTAKFTSPETVEGKKYWGKLYQKAEEIFGTSNITIPTLTRPWIVPGEIIIREAEDNAYIYKATLKVCLEQDYLKESATYNFKDERLKQLNEYSSQLIRELIIPKLTKEINCSKRYASLRQVYYSLILAQWFKQKFYGKGGLYSWLIDRHNLAGLTSKTDWAKTTYFKEYQKSFKDGEYNIEEQVDSISGKTFRTYFSGGISFMGEAIKAGLGVGAKIPANPKKLELPENPKHLTKLSIKGGTVNDPSSIEVADLEIKEEVPGSQSDTALGGGNIGSGQIKDKTGQGQGKQEEKKFKKPSLFRRIITSIILTSVILNFFASRNLIFAATSRAFQEKTRIEKGEKAAPMINKMIDSFSPGEWKEVLGMYKNKDFQDKTIKLSHANRFSLARAIVYTLRRFDAPANDENINKVLPFILKTRENYSSRVILDKSKNFIIASHKEFGFEYITELPKSFGIEKYEMFKPANSADVAAVKQAFIKSVENSPFNTTILLEGHGGQNHFWLEGGEIGEHVSYDLHKPEAISYKELAEALINRAKSHNGKLSDLTILVESCFSANFIVNTLNALAEEHNKGAIEDLPVIITAVNRNSTGYVGNFIADIQRAAQYGEYKGKLTLSDVYKAEETADYLQDYAFFLPVSKEELKELAQTLAEGKNEEHPPYIQLEATRIDPSLPIIDGQIGKRAQLESIDLQKNEIKVRDSAGAARVISLAAQARLDVAAVKSQIEAMQDMKEGHKKIILEVLSLLEKSPPSLYTFTSLVEDFFGFASKKDNLIAIHQSFLDNPIAIFHEIGEYLVQSGVLNLTLEGNSLNISVNGQQFSLVLQGETLAIAQKDPTNPHYLLRALQREMFGGKDRVLTQEIKKKQNTPSRIAAAFVDYYNNLANKIGQFSERFSKRQKAKLNNSFLEAARIGKDEKQIRKILSGILKKEPSYVKTALGVYRRYPQGFVACVEAGVDLNEIARKKLPPFGAEWKAASQLEELAEVFQSSRDKGNLLVQIKDNEREYRYTLLEIRLEKEYGDAGIQLAQVAKRNGINEPDSRDLEVFLGKDYKLDTSELLKFLQNAQNRGQDARVLIKDLTYSHYITLFLLRHGIYDTKAIDYLRPSIESYIDELERERALSFLQAMDENIREKIVLLRGFGDNDLNWDWRKEFGFINGLAKCIEKDPALLKDLFEQLKSLKNEEIAAKTILTAYIINSLEKANINTTDDQFSILLINLLEDREIRLQISPSAGFGNYIYRRLIDKLNKDVFDKRENMGDLEYRLIGLLIKSRVTPHNSVIFIKHVIDKKDKSCIQIIEELSEALYVNNQYRLNFSDMVNALLQREAKYETKRNALGYIAESLSIANSYDEGANKANTQEIINTLKETIGQYSKGEIGDKKFLNQLKNTSFKFKTTLFNELLSKPISQEEMEQIWQQLGANKLFSLTGIYFRIREQDVKDKIRIVLDKLVEFQGDIKKLNRWLYEESEWNKEEIAELIKMGYDASLWRDGIVIEEEVSSQEAGEALKQISKQTEQLIEIAEKLGIPVSGETKRNGLNSYQEAKQFVDEVIVPAKDKEKMLTDLSRILNETERLEKIYQDTKIRKEMVRVEIKKDFLEDAYSGVGVPGCFNPITGIHKEAPLVHALESNGFFLRVYQQEKMIANAVIVLTDKGAVVFGLYNSTNLNLDEAVFEAIKELTHKVPKVLMINQSASFDKAKLYGQEETVLATKHEKVIEEAYHDFGESANGNTIFDMSLSLTQDMIQEKGGFKEKPKRTVAVMDKGPKGADFNWDGLAKSMISQGLKDYLFLIGELKKDKVDMNTVTRETILGTIIQKGRQISNNDLDKTYEIIQSLLNVTTAVDLGAQVSYVKNLDRLLRILNILRKSENVPERSESASDREIIEFCINELNAQGLIEGITDEYGNRIIKIKKEAENNRLAQAIREWAIDPEGGVKAINFQGPDGVWTIVGFASELEDKNTLEHEQKEISYRRQGYSWIDAHNKAIKELGVGVTIDGENAKQYGAGSQDEVGAAIGKNALPRLIAQGDIHGELDGFRENLRKAGLINGNSRWIGGRAILVQVGDVIDRGPQSREAFEFLQRLQEEARAADGDVIRLLGNHELMLLEGDLHYANFDNPQELIQRIRNDTLQGRLKAAYIFGDRLFVHGGLRSKVREMIKDEVTKQKGISRDHVKLEDIAERMNQILVESVRNNDFSHAIFQADAARGGSAEVAGIFWNDFKDLMLSQDAAQIKQIVGHTPERKKGARPRWSESLGKINIDVGLFEGYGGNNAFLEVNNNQLKVFIKNRDGEWEEENLGEFTEEADKNPDINYSEQKPSEPNAKIIGGQRKGGTLEAVFAGDIWITAGSFAYKISITGDTIYFQRYKKDKISPVGKVHTVSLGRQIEVGREAGDYRLPDDTTLSSKHFLFRVTRAENGKFMLRVEDLKSLNGTAVEWNEPHNFELADPGKGPGAASRLEFPNNKTREAKRLLETGNIVDAHRLLVEAIEDYQGIIKDYGDTKGEVSDLFLQAAKKNIMIAQMLLDKIPGKKGPPLSIHKKENGLQGSNIDALINYRIQRWSKWLQDSKDRLKTLNPEQIPAVIIKNEEKLARERENVLSRTLELKNIMKSDNIREFVRALKEVSGGAEKELSSRQKIILATITKELKGHPYIDFNPEEILFIPASSWLHDFFEFKGVCGRIMAVNDGTDSGNIILIDESRNKNNLELLNTLIHEIIHKQFRNGGYIVQQARPQERQLFRILEEALTERLARKLTQDIYRRNPQISAKSPEEKLFEIIYGEETAYLSKSYPMEGRFLEEILKALGGNAEEAIFDCLKTGNLTLLRDLLGSRWEKIVAVIEGTNAKSDFYNLGLYIISRLINNKNGERGLDASIKALNIIKRIDIWDVLGEKAVELYNFNPNGGFIEAIVSRAGVKLLDEILGASAADFDSKDIKDKFIEYVRAETLKFIQLKVDFDKAGSRKHPLAERLVNYQMGKLAKGEITPDLKLKVTDSKGNVSILDLALQGEMDINSLKSQIESMQDIENDHKQLILDILSLLEKSPPKLYNFSTLIEDLFGVASSEHSLIALHYGLSDNPIAAFHEAGEYLISLGLLDIRLEGDVLMVSIKDKKNALILEGKTLSIAQKNPGNPHYLLRALQRAVFKYEDWKLTWQIKERQTEISKQLVTSSLTNIYQAMVDMYESEQVLEAMLPRMNILEIGPGDKTDLISLFKSRGANIVGVDLSYVDFPAKTIESGLVKKVKGGAAEYLKGVKPRTLDIIYSDHVLEEGNPSITRGEIREILISSKEALKDNGYIIIQVFDEFGAPSEEELRTLGFIIKRSESMDEGRHYLWVLQKAPQIDSKPEARNPGEVKESETPPDSKGDVASAVGPDKDRKNSGISSRAIRGFRIEERIMDEIFEKVRQTRPVEVFGILAGSITAEGDVRISEMFDITIKESTEFGLDFDEEEVDKIVHGLQSENKACLFWHSHTPSFLRQGLSIFSPQDINGLQAHGVSGGLIFGDRWAVASYLKEDATVEYKPIEILRNGNRLEENEISEKYGVQLARYNRHIELSDKELQEDLLEQGIFQSFYSTPYYDPVEIKKYLQTILLRLNSYKKSGLSEIVKKDLEEIEALSLYIRALWRHDIDEEGNVIIPQSNGMKLKAKLEQFVKKEGLSFRFGAPSIKEALDLIEKKTAALLINEGTNIESIERPLGVGDVLVNSNKNDINRRMLVYLGATTDYFTPETYSYEFIPLDISGKVTSSKSIRISPFEFSRLRYSLWKLVPSAPLGSSNFSSKEGLFKPGGIDDSTGSPSISRETKNQGRIDKIETPPDSEVDNKELRQIIAKFEGQIEVSPDDVAQYVPEEIKIILDIAKELGLTMVLTGGTARDFAIAAHLKRKLPMPVLSDIDIAIIPEDGSAVLGYGDWAKEKYELLNEELRKRGYTYKVDFSAGVRTQDTYVFENFMNTKSSSAFGLSRLAAAWAGSKYIIFGTSEALNDLNNKVLSVDIEKVDAPGEGMSTKMIGKEAIYRDFAGIEMDSYLKESILKDVNLIKGKGKDAITKFVKDIFDYMKVNDKNDDPIERLRKTIRELNLSEALGFSEEELIKLAQGSPGGIDFRTMPIITQPMQSSSVRVSLGAEVSSLAKAVPVANLDNEWQEIQNMLNAGMIPSGERIKEYLQDSSRKHDFSHDIDKIISCISDILRMEEERVSQTEPALKELLVLLESDKPASEIQLSLAKITILPAILKPVNP